MKLDIRHYKVDIEESNWTFVDKKKWTLVSKTGHLQMKIVDNGEYNWTFMVKKVDNEE